MARRERFSVGVLEVLEGLRIGANLSPSPIDADITVTEGGASESDVTIQLGYNDAQGEFQSVAGLFIVDIFLSEDADGAGISTDAPDSIAVVTGSEIAELTAALAYRVQSDATGLIELTITDTTTPGANFPVVVFPLGNIVVGPVLAYGS